MVSTDRGHFSDFEAECRGLDEHLGVEDKVIAVLEKRNRFQESPRVGAIASVVLGQAESEHAVLRRGQESVPEPLPPRHAGLGRIQSKPT